MHKRMQFVALCSLFLLSACVASRSGQKESFHKIPAAAKEFRAAWVATVSNINWPSKPGLSTEQQQQEAIKLLDFLKDHRFNAVVFQVRPQTDALYKSDIEPWSYYLTGDVGKAPDPYYDPLEFWVEAAHDRGLELHVWLNPYRSHHKDGGLVSDKSIVKTKSHLSVFLKEGYWWLDPAKKETQDHSASVVMDLVRRYDIDGVHFDDYFYPYPSYNLNEDFPDSATYAAYLQDGGKLSRGDWRRHSVNIFIERLYKQIKKEKEWVKFGLSPFGIWRPGYPESIEGFDQHDKLYADARLWLNKGWIDYFTPQLYWEINRIPQSFPVLLGWWAGENTKNRHLWPGISVYKGGGEKNIDETINEIMISRGMLPRSKGVVHWSISGLTRNDSLAKAIANGPYKKPALVPPTPWLDRRAPREPDVSVDNKEDSVLITWSHPEEKDVFRWVVYYQYGTIWNYEIFNRKDSSFNLQNYSGEKRIPLNSVVVTAVDRVGNESRFKTINVIK
ncbi:MAG: glycoside hydrolase family 10 protein [Chitinophagaceae bacterium]